MYSLESIPVIRFLRLGMDMLRLLSTHGRLWLTDIL